MYKTRTCTSEGPKGKKGPYPHTSSLQSLCLQLSLLRVSVLSRLSSQGPRATW